MAGPTAPTEREIAYAGAVAWVAINDDPLERDPKVVADRPTVALLAAMFCRHPDVVAADVIRFRFKHWKD